MIQQLVYMSISEQVSPQTIQDILRSAHKNNPQLGITGILLLVGNTFIQILEGPKECVSSLFELIKKDTRHHDVQCLSEQPVEERAFPDWSMGYVEKTPSEIKAIAQHYDANGNITAKIKEISITHEWLGDFILNCQEAILD